jgi:membrane protein
MSAKLRFARWLGLGAIKHLFGEGGGDHPRWYDFLICVVRQFVKDQCVTRATSLAYTSLFSLMPVLIVSYTVFSGFPEFAQLGPKVQSMMLDNFVPEVAGELKQVGESFMHQASELSLTGFLGLLIVAVLMVFNIEQGFNHIWHARRQRDGVSSFLLYWAVITLAPILLAVAVSISGYIAALPIMVASSKFFLAKLFLVMMKLVLTAGFFGMLYCTVPNCTVRLRDALLGGAVAMVLFEGTKKLLVLYITKFTSYKLLYGALAAMPIFLIWLYLLWIILLFGAEVAHMAGLFRQGKRSV